MQLSMNRNVSISILSVSYTHLSTYLLNWYKPNYSRHFYCLFQLTPQETVNIGASFKSKDALRRDGRSDIRKCPLSVLEEDRNTVCARTKGERAITMQASKTAIVIWHCPYVDGQP